MLENPLAQAVSYIIIEASSSGCGPASPGFSKRDHYFSSTSKYFVGTITCHSLCSSGDIINFGDCIPQLYVDRNRGVVSRQCGPCGTP